MKTQSEENCENHKNVTRYGDKWQCVICGEEFVIKVKPISKLEETLREDYNDKM